MQKLNGIQIHVVTPSKRKKGNDKHKFRTAASYVGGGYEWAHGQNPY